MLSCGFSDITRRSQWQWENRAPELRYDPSAWNTSRPPDECYSLMTVELDEVYNDWLLQRVIVQRLHGDRSELLRLSDRMLSYGLSAVTQGGGDIGFNYCDLPWSVSISSRSEFVRQLRAKSRASELLSNVQKLILVQIVLFCLPAAGVLVLELLRQSQARSQDNNAFSRSRVIQNLSILISSLEWIVRPGIGNYELCRQARGMLKRSLDRILDPSLLEKDKPNGTMNPSNAHAQQHATPSAPDANNLFAVEDPTLGWGGEDWLGITADPGTGEFDLSFF